MTGPAEAAPTGVGDGGFDPPPVQMYQMPICDQCVNGAGGECHTPGCTFWVCPAPDAEQAERIRNHSEPVSDLSAGDFNAVDYLHAVLDLHKPITDSEDGETYCTVCQPLLIRFPCPTVAALGAADER